MNLSSVMNLAALLNQSFQAGLVKKISIIDSKIKDHSRILGWTVCSPLCTSICAFGTFYNGHMKNAQRRKTLSSSGINPSSV